MDARADLPIGSEPLPYRQRHIASTGLSATRGPLSAGCRFTYKSGIDPAPGLFPEGTRDLIPVYLVDLSLGCRVGKSTVTLKVLNLTQYNYARVERNLGAPRRLSIGISGVY
ncbi:MAG TPA: hypothetical protein DIU35_04475 [Candidatus Latescibacteria bacterium]|nr:hypothetical protein [Candidatus Latescibacterota bacterium]